MFFGPSIPANFLNRAFPRNPSQIGSTRSAAGVTHESAAISRSSRPVASSRRPAPTYARARYARMNGPETASSSIGSS